MRARNRVDAIAAAVDGSSCKNLNLESGARPNLNTSCANLYWCEPAKPGLSDQAQTLTSFQAYLLHFKTSIQT